MTFVLRKLKYVLWNVFFLKYINQRALPVNLFSCTVNYDHLICSFYSWFCIILYIQCECYWGYHMAAEPSSDQSHYIFLAVWNFNYFDGILFAYY